MLIDVGQQAEFAYEKSDAALLGAAPAQRTPRRNTMPNPPDPDRIDEAIRSAQAGDAEAFEVVIRTYQRPLRSWVSQWCAGGIDPDEVAHRSFILAFQHVRQFTPGTNCFAWLCAIARNVLHEEIRAFRHHTARMRVVDADVDMAARDIDEGESVEIIHILRECLSALPTEAADLAGTYYGGGKSVAECAVEFEKSEAAIKSQLHWIRMKLRNCMTFKLGRAWL